MNTALLFYCFVILISCFFQSIFGFGNSLISTPLLLLILSKEVVVVANAITGVLLNAVLAKKITAPINRSLFLQLCLGSLFGMPIGILLLVSLQLATLKLVVGFLSIVFSLLLTFRKVTMKPNSVSFVGTGFVCGIIQTSTTMFGPLLVLLLIGMKLTKDEMRKTIVSFSAFVSVVTLALSFLAKIITYEGLLYGLIGFPIVYLATIPGMKLAKRIPANKFNAIGIGIVLITGLMSIISGLTGG